MGAGAVQLHTFGLSTMLINCDMIYTNSVSRCWSFGVNVSPLQSMPGVNLNNFINFMKYQPVSVSCLSVQIDPAVSYA
jgi:hypothetical protein